MRSGFPVVLFAVLVLASACSSRSALNASQVESDVREYMATVARDITHDGPTAWRKHFADTPAFFMVANGNLAFRDSADATKGIQALPNFIKQLQLQWGSDLRVDPLTPQFAVVAAPYHEVLTDPAGKITDSTGYFTAVAEYQDGRWQFRDVHWSEILPKP